MKLRFIGILCFTVLITGCGAVVVGGAAAGGAAVGSDSRGASDIVYDNSISQQAQMRLASNPDLQDKTHIAASSYNGMLLLTGQTPTPEQRTEAVDTVKNVPGVKMIYDEITIGQPTPMKVRSNDAWLTTKVKSKLLGTKNLKSGSIKVITEDSTVYLLGIVPPSQANLAANSASQVDGVKKVVKLFETPT